MRFNKLDINPAVNPAILDTATWDPAAAWAATQAVDDAYWPALLEAAASGAPLPATAGLTPYALSVAWHEGTLYCLAGLADGQQVFLALGPHASDAPLGAPLGVKSLPTATAILQPPISSLQLYSTDVPVLDRFVRHVKPDSGPRALGAVPRLGIGTRMTTAVWPAIWEAMGGKGTTLHVNAIQNSVRELNLLDTLLHGQPPETNVAFGFGTIEAGYTGSTFEGLWVAGVLDALKRGAPPRYGADADHLQVKRGPDGLARAKRLVEASRYYSFYTLDVSDVLDYAALAASSAAAAAYLDGRVPAADRSALRAYHRRPRSIGGYDYRLDDAALGRLVGKYWDALAAVEALRDHIASLKACPEQSRRACPEQSRRACPAESSTEGSGEQSRGNGVSFDLELSIDEHPPEVATFDCLTSEAELIFVLLEAQRRGLSLTHIAPNFGIEKGTDYRCPDGLTGLETRARTLSRITEEFGVMADFHSGDDLSAATRRVIGRATGGRNHFKVSPMLQLLFGEVLADHHPDLFRRWYEDALAYARRAAAGGSAFAAGCIRRDLTPSAPPSLRGKGEGGIGEVFHHFSFAFVGRRDADGQFLHRDEFYRLSPAFYRAYQERIVRYLGELAADLF